jgi:glycosyltransferase involved in cell wall biosynthesis
MAMPYYNEADTLPFGPKLAVVVTCHAAYLPLLGKALASIDAQHGQAHKILCLDGCDYDHAPCGWVVLRGDWGCPNPARNEGWRNADARGCQWCVFWDADNVMPDGYLVAAKERAGAVSPSVGILSPDVIRGQSGQSRFQVRQPERRDMWDGRAKSLSDTSSVWRIEALHQSGGFMSGNTMLDDYTLALAVTRLGWQVEPLRMAVWLEDGHTRSTHDGRGLADLWINRTCHVVTLLAGRSDALRPWSAAVHAMELPPHTHITLVNDSQCRRFTRDVQAEATSLLMLPHVRSVRIIEAPEGERPTTWREIHRRVAMLYNLALSGQTHDMVLLWEDDVIPKSDALLNLHVGFTPFSRQAAVGAVYPARCNPAVAVASMHADRWGAMPLLGVVGDWISCGLSRKTVGMLGGGFTLWAGHYLMPALPLLTTRTLGWDGSLSKAVTELGGTLQLDLRTHAQHLTAS